MDKEIKQAIKVLNDPDYERDREKYTYTIIHQKTAQKLLPYLNQIKYREVQIAIQRIAAFGPDYEEETEDRKHRR